MIRGLLITFSIKKYLLGCDTSHALAGFDDIRTSSLAGIQLTTISHKKYEMGELGVKILVEKFQQEVPPMVNHIVLQAQMIIRKSCGFHLKGGYVRYFFYVKLKRLT